VAEPIRASCERTKAGMEDIWWSADRQPGQANRHVLVILAIEARRLWSSSSGYTMTMGKLSREDRGVETIIPRDRNHRRHDPSRRWAWA
jgi:hypothetical protein